MQSIWTGETAGMEDAAKLADMADRRRIAREQIKAGLQEAAIRQQTQLALAQQGGRPPSLAAAAGPEQPATQWGERVQGGQPVQPPAPHKQLVDYIQGVVMGNPLEAEKGFDMVHPGTTKVNPDGSISFTSKEGHPVNIPKEAVQAHGGMTAGKPISEYEREMIQIRDEANAIRREGVEKPEHVTTEAEQARIDQQKFDLDQQHKTASGIIAEAERAAELARKAWNESKTKATNWHVMGPNSQTDAELAAEEAAKAAYDDAVFKRDQAKIQYAPVPSLAGADQKATAAQERMAAAPAGTPAEPDLSHTRGSLVEAPTGRGTARMGGRQVSLADVQGESGTGTITAPGRQVSLATMDATAPGARHPAADTGASKTETPKPTVDKPPMVGSQVGQKKRDKLTGRVWTWNGRDWELP